MCCGGMRLLVVSGQQLVVDGQLVDLVEHSEIQQFIITLKDVNMVDFRITYTLCPAKNVKLRQIMLS